MSAWCNSVNKSNLQFSGARLFTNESVGDLTLTQFFKTCYNSCNVVQVFENSSLEVKKKRNLSNTSTGARPNRSSLPFSLPSFPFSPETPDTQARMTEMTHVSLVMM